MVGAASTRLEGLSKQNFFQAVSYSHDVGNLFEVSCCDCHMQAHAVTPGFLPSHMARLDDEEKAGKSAMATFIDLLLLAWARCLVASESGFSETAWMLGGGRTCLGRLQDKLGVCSLGSLLDTQQT
jgi:hypothetical protein